MLLRAYASSPTVGTQQIDGVCRNTIFIDAEVRLQSPWADHGQNRHFCLCDIDFGSILLLCEVCCALQLSGHCVLLLFPDKVYRHWLDVLETDLRRICVFVARWGLVWQDEENEMARQKEEKNKMGRNKKVIYGEIKLWKEDRLFVCLLKYFELV